MAESKKSFIAYSDWKETFDSLPDEYAGKLIKHIFAYVNDENPNTEDFIINSVFSNIKNTLKRDLKKWDKQIEQRSEAGKKSAEMRKKKAEEAKELENSELEFQRNPTTVESRSTRFNEETRNPTDSVSVSVSVSDINKKELLSEIKISNDNPLLIDLDVSNEKLEVKITKSLFDLFRKNQIEQGVTVFKKYDRTKLNSWLTHIDKMIRIDKVTREELQSAYVWLSDGKYKNSEFWRKNILSTEKLREQYPKLQIAMKEDLQRSIAPKNERTKSRLGL